MQISIEFSILEFFLTIKHHGQFDLLYLELIISGFMFCMAQLIMSVFNLKEPLKLVRSLLIFHEKNENIMKV